MEHVSPRYVSPHADVSRACHGLFQVLNEPLRQNVGPLRPGIYPVLAMVMGWGKLLSPRGQIPSAYVPMLLGMSMELSCMLTRQFMPVVIHMMRSKIEYRLSSTNDLQNLTENFPNAIMECRIQATQQ